MCVRVCVCPAEQAVSGDEKKQEYITAVLPGQGGPIPISHSAIPHSPILPDGSSQYINLPADPRVLSGEYSYAVLQQPDGSSQIVLMENSSISQYY